MNRLLLLVLMGVVMVSNCFAGDWVTRSNDIKVGDVYYEIRSLESNDRGEIEQRVLHKCEIMKFRIEKDERFGTLSHLIDHERGVEIQEKIYK